MGTAPTVLFSGSWNPNGLDLPIPADLALLGKVVVLQGLAGTSLLNSEHVVVQP